MRWCGECCSHLSPAKDRSIRSWSSSRAAVWQVRESRSVVQHSTRSRISSLCLARPWMSCQKSASRPEGRAECGVHSNWHSAAARAATRKEWRRRHGTHGEWRRGKWLRGGIRHLTGARRLLQLVQAGGEREEFCRMEFARRLASGTTHIENSSPKWRRTRSLRATARNSWSHFWSRWEQRSARHADSLTHCAGVTARGLSRECRANEFVRLLRIMSRSHCRQRLPIRANWCHSPRYTTAINKTSKVFHFMAFQQSTRERNKKQACVELLKRRLWQ